MDVGVPREQDAVAAHSFLSVGMTVIFLILIQRLKLSLTG